MSGKSYRLITVRIRGETSTIPDWVTLASKKFHDRMPPKTKKCYALMAYALAYRRRHDVPSHTI